MGSNLTNTLLGLLAVPGNQIVYYTCAMIAEKAGFRNQEKTHTFNVCLYTFAVFVNIVVDLALLLILAHGYIQDQASGLDATATIRNPSFQHALFIQLVGYLYPGTLLAPYLFEPIPMNIAPYYLGKWMVRSALHVTRYEAEQCLVCPPFDLLRYGDITINVMLVIMCFFLTAQALWWVFMWLFISLAVIYAWDHYRFLRQTQRTQFASDKMEVCSQYITAFPCALLAAAFVFKWYGGDEIMESFDIHIKKDWRTEWKDINHNVWSVAIGAFLVHIVFHFFILAFIVPLFIPAQSPRDAPYRDCAANKACNWWNANPVHCLRSKFIHQHDPPHIYHVYGKEYLHMKNDKLHMFYECKTFKEETTFLEGLKSAESWIRERAQRRHTDNTMDEERRQAHPAERRQVHSSYDASSSSRQEHPPDSPSSHPLPPKKSAKFTGA